MPALFTSASIDPNLLIAVSITLGGLRGAFTESPSTRARWPDPLNAPDFVMLRELATTL